MKKISIVLLSVFFTFSAHATCSFKDTFTISAPNSTKILTAKTANNLHYEKKSDTVFMLSCEDVNSNEAGYFYTDIGYNDNNKCNLVIHDGPFKTASVASVHCEGKISFADMTHGFASHDYILKFAD